MLLITDIKYKSDHTEVNFDTGESLKIPVSSTGRYRLEKGKTLEADEYRHLRDESEQFNCRQKALDYLSARNRTSHELCMKLRKRGFSALLAHETVEEMRRAGYINDFAYAGDYIRARRKKKLVGKSLLNRELQAKGIPRAIIQKVLEEADFPEADFEEVYRLAEMRLGRIDARANKLQKVGLFLTRRGFKNDMIQKILMKLRREHILNDEGVSDAQC